MIEKSEYSLLQLPPVSRVRRYAIAVPGPCYPFMRPNNAVERRLKRTFWKQCSYFAGLQRKNLDLTGTFSMRRGDFWGSDPDFFWLWVRCSPNNPILYEHAKSSLFMLCKFIRVREPDLRDIYILESGVPGDMDTISAAIESIGKHKPKWIKFWTLANK